MATYYVSLAGNDSNNGSIDFPKQTTAAGISLLQAGDTLYIRGGAYDGRLNAILGKSGTPSNPITIAGYPGETVTLRPLNGQRIFVTDSQTNNWVFRNMKWDGQFSQDGPAWSNRLGDGASGFLFEDIEIFNWLNSGLLLTAVNNVILRRCKIHHQPSINCQPGTRNYAIYGHHGNNWLIEDCEIYENDGGGMQIYPGPINGVIIRRNKVYRNSTCDTSPVGGILLMETDPANTSNPGGDIVNAEVYNNLCYDNRASSTHATAGIRISQGVDGAKIWNNTIFGHAYGVNVQSGSTPPGPPTNIEVRNNLLFGFTTQAIPNAGIGTIISNNMTIDPLFVNSAQKDFHLQIGSPAINAGVAIPQISTDLDGNLRAGLPDIGCYERVGGMVYYVSPSGLDTNDGSLSTPWRTIQKAVTSMVAGDTAIVADGVYTDTDNDGKTVSITGAVASGESVAPITLKSQNVFGAQISLPSLHSDPTPYRNSGIYINKPFWVIDGFDIFGGTGIATQNGYAGIYVQGTVAADVKIKNCRVRSIGANLCTGSPMQFVGILGQQAVRLTVESCLVFSIGRRRSGESGCALTPGGSGVTNNDHGIVLDNCSSPIVKRNIVYDVTRGYAVFVQSSTATPNTTVKLFNNTFADGVLSGVPRSHIWLGGTIQGAEIKNNISSNPFVAMIGYGASPVFSSLDVDYNVCTGPLVDGATPNGMVVGVNNKPSVNPLFSDAPSRIYTLSIGSPAIDAGTDVGELFVGSAPDAGALEGVDTIAPSAPTGLTVT